MMPRIVNPAKIAESLDELWSPRIIAELDDSYVKVAKVQGEFSWHAHDDEDELFYILKGELRIDFETSSIHLKSGEAYVVPKGVSHRPVAQQECHIMLIERKTTLHTGNVATPHTRTLAEQLRSIDQA